MAAHRTFLHRDGWLRRGESTPASLTQQDIYIRAFGWGVLGAMLMSSIMVLARWIGLTDFVLEQMLGSALTRQTDAATWFGGVIIHFLAGGLFALIYARIFNAWGGASAARGAAIGVVHGVLSGLLLLALPLLHPAIPELFKAPGFMGIHHGWLTAVAFLALHVIYGAVVGAGCAPPRIQKELSDYPGRPRESVLGGRVRR